MLAIYIVLFTAAGVYQWVHPPATVLASKHDTFWASIPLLAVGTGHTVGFWPRLGIGRSNGGSRVE